MDTPKENETDGADAAGAAYARLRHELEVRVRQRIHTREADDVADEALVKAVVHWLQRGCSCSLRALAMASADTCCVDWIRRRARRGHEVPMPEELGLECEDEHPSMAVQKRPTILLLLARAKDRALLTPRQEGLADLLYSGEAQTMHSLAQRMSMSTKDLGEVMLALAKKLRRVADDDL